MDCHGATRLAMTIMESVAIPKALAAMPKTFVIASEARQSTSLMDYRDASRLAMTKKPSQPAMPIFLN
jgi:hypothetical protein